MLPPSSSTAAGSSTNVSISRAIARFMRSARHSRSSRIAPLGSVCVMMQSTTARTCAISGASSEVSR